MPYAKIRFPIGMYVTLTACELMLLKSISHPSKIHHDAVVLRPEAFSNGKIVNYVSVKYIVKPCNYLFRNYSQYYTGIVII